MKILFDHPLPFMLAHGGFQTQIEQTTVALRSLGAEVEPLRWWDTGQVGDLIHFFGAPSLSYQRFAAMKGLPIVNTALFSETCNRSRARLLAQATVTRLALRIPIAHTLKRQLSWQSFRSSRCIIVGLEAEKRVLRLVYGIPEDRIRVVPLGCEKDFFVNATLPRNGKYLISVGTISRQKRTLELAQIALGAQVPILFVGKPYGRDDSYWKQFYQLVDDKTVLYREHVSDRQEMVRLYRGARGFVLYSTFENWSLVADEAAAGGLPLLLPDQPWSRERFGETASYFPIGRTKDCVKILGRFYSGGPDLSLPPKPKTWEQVGSQLLDIYTEAASNSR